MKIICIGRNYSEHAKELNNPVPEKPIFFMKPDTAIVNNNDPVYYPEHSNDLHYEVEIVIKICKKGKHISEKFASGYYQEIGIGIDFTARDVQAECKKKGLPWEIAKAFDQSAPVSSFINKDKLNNSKSINFSLSINGIEKQVGNTEDMIFSFNNIIAYVSKFVTLKEGDLIFTGTPSGVGSVSIDDHFQAFIEGDCMLDFVVK
ncbi:MAG: fumarylacetoacetate hydrolase family protein [Bacteroidetes bacterium]|nr:fumarylacetoacetate hydrolase family protein [Bacteroidota bacterium]